MKPDVSPSPTGEMEQRLEEICRLLSQAGTPRLEPAAGSAEAGGALGGWFIRGGSADQARAATRLAERLLGAEAEIDSLCREIVERYEEATLIYRLSQQLGTAFGERATARLVVEEASRALGARQGEVWLVRDGEIGLAASVPEDSVADGVLRDEGALAALRELRPWIREAGLGSEAAVAVPLIGPDGESIGVMVLRGREDGRPFGTGEVKLLSAVACLAAAFVRNDRLAEQARESQERQRRSELARQVHETLRSSLDVRFPGLDVACGGGQADALGGEYYGHVLPADGSLVLAIASISGEGVGAALCMAAAKGALETEARRAVSPAEILRRTNETLSAEFTRSDVFATAFVLRVAPGGRQVAYANGGHAAPVLRRADGRVEPLQDGGPALGVLEDAEFASGDLVLAHGDVLAMFAGELAERPGTGAVRFGTHGLVETLHATAGRSAREIYQAVVSAARERRASSAGAGHDPALVVVRSTVVAAAEDGR